MRITCFVSANCSSMKESVPSTLPPGPIRGRTASFSARSRYCARRRAICCGGLESPEAEPGSELVHSVGRADLEPAVTKIIHHERIANSHECLLNARFDVEILRDLDLVVACPALLGHLPVIALLVIPALHAQFVAIAGVCFAKNSGFDIVLDRSHQDFVVPLIPDTNRLLG